MVYPGEPFSKIPKSDEHLSFHFGHVQTFQECHLMQNKEQAGGQRPRQQGARFPGFKSGYIYNICRFSGDENGYHDTNMTLQNMIYYAVEVRDSWTGYLIPVRYWLGVWPDWRVVGAPSSASPGNSGWHSGQETIFEVFKLDLTHMRALGILRPGFYTKCRAESI